jgi:di/tricarboxylate transporter
MWYVLAVIVVPLLLLSLNRLRVDVAALFMIVSLGLAQFLGLKIFSDVAAPDQALVAVSGFSQPVVITLLGLFILTQTLTQNGVILWLGQRLSRAAGNSEARLVFLFTSASALLSQIMNNVAVGALLLPSAMYVVRRTKLPASKLLIPIAFGAALGGMATYFTTANIVVSNLLTSARPPQPPLGVLSFVPTGGLIAVSGIVFITLFGRRLLPRREPGLEQSIARRQSSELESLYAVGERLWECRIEAASPLAGRTLRESAIGERFGIVVVAVRRGQRAFSIPSLSEALQPGDILLVVGREDRVSKLAELGVRSRPGTRTLTTSGIVLVESILAPHSAYAARTLKDINFRQQYGFAAIAVLRRGRSYRTDVADMPLETGDSLLMVGPQQGVRLLRLNPNLIIFEPDPASRPVPRLRAVISVLIFLSAIVLALLGFPVSLSVLAAALFAVLFGLLHFQDVYRLVEWRVIFFIAGMYAASLAMIHTGLAGLIGRQVIEMVGGHGPLRLAAVVFLLSAGLGQVISSQATAFVVGPIAISAAIHLQTNPQAAAVAVAIGSSASFLTPLAHPVNLIMMGPGNYRFGDFARVGAGLMVVVFLALLAAMALFWQL